MEIPMTGTGATRRRTAPVFTVARVYDADAPAGTRVLVDRLWPRGVTKDEARLDEWLKDAAPSTELRRWYGHDPTRFDEFAHRYRKELAEPPAADAVRHLTDLGQAGPVTLLTATRDVKHSGAHVLRDHLLPAPQQRSQRHRPADLACRVVRSRRGGL
jgi:uncharacterized protein YeaO (DUF488 family)